jgi:hypothetical protein
MHRAFAAQQKAAQSARLFSMRVWLFNSKTLRVV